MAQKIEDYKTLNEHEIRRAIEKKWLSCKSISYFKFILSLAKRNFNFNIKDFSEREKLMCIMLHYDVWQSEKGFNSIEESIKSIGKNKILIQEIIEILEILIDKIDFIEIEQDLPYIQPLNLHGRYTRDQIFAAFEVSTFESKSSNREGVAVLRDKNTELIFVTLEKTEENYSPTTMYNDYAVNEKIFHWQSQNSAKPDSGKGLSYIKHEENDKIVLLFVREKNKDEFGNTMGYVFLGIVDYKDHYGSKPMSINWELKEPMPPYLWKDCAKMAIG